MKTSQNIEGYERIKIGTHIRKWRNIKDVKQKELAKALRVSEAAISNLENDLTDITLSQIEDISITLNVPFEDLFMDPQETIHKYSEQTKEAKTNQVMEKDLIYALISSIQKKEQQFEEWMLKMMQTMDAKENVRMRVRKSVN